MLVFQVMELLQKGNKNRTTEPTRVNETSSRSHAVLQVKSIHILNLGEIVSIVKPLTTFGNYLWKFIGCRRI